MKRACVAALIVLASAASAFGQTGWSSADIGDVGVAGTAAEINGVWTVQRAGGDIWGAADAFVYRPARTDDTQIVARVDDQQNTNPFAKTGVMLRSNLDPSAATVILDAKPSGEVDFMVRSAAGGQMSYIGGAFVTLPAWLRLTWLQPSSGTIEAASAWVSQDGVTWALIAGHSAAFSFEGSNIFAGAAVTSHDVTQLNTAHVESLSVFSSAQTSTDVGATGLPGNVSLDLNGALTIEGAGGDTWGSADAFQFVHLRLATVFADAAYRVSSLDDTDPFAKAGLMFREDGPPARSR